MWKINCFFEVFFFFDWGRLPAPITVCYWFLIDSYAASINLIISSRVKSSTWSSWVSVRRLYSSGVSLIVFFIVIILSKFIFCLCCVFLYLTNILYTLWTQKSTVFWNFFVFFQSRVLSSPINPAISNATPINAQGPNRNAGSIAMRIAPRMIRIQLMLRLRFSAITSSQLDCTRSLVFSSHYVLAGRPGRPRCRSWLAEVAVSTDLYLRDAACCT